MKNRLRLGIFFVFIMFIMGGCDRDEMVEPKIAQAIQSIPSMGETNFSHQLHSEDLGLDCVDCHHETDAAQLNFPHEKFFKESWIDCGICHHETKSPQLPQSCSNCHHPSPTNIADETLSAKVVIHQTCWTCHEIGVGEGASQECRFCHSP